MGDNNPQYALQVRLNTALYNFEKIYFNRSNFRGIENVKQYVMGGGRPQIPIYMPKFYTRLLKMCWTSSPDLRPDFKALVKELEIYKRGRREPFGDRNLPTVEVQELPSQAKLISNKNREDEVVVDLDDSEIKERYWSL